MPLINGRSAVGSRPLAGAVWKPGTVVIDLFDHPTDTMVGQHKTKGLVYGYWGVCPSALSVLIPRAWSLVHLATRRTAVKMTLEADCKAIGEYLQANHTMLFRGDDLERMRSQRPDWLKDWLEQCQAQDKLLPVLEA